MTLQFSTTPKTQEFLISHPIFDIMFRTLFKQRSSIFFLLATLLSGACAVPTSRVAIPSNVEARLQIPDPEVVNLLATMSYGHVKYFDKISTLPGNPEAKPKEILEQIDNVRIPDR